MGTKSSKKDIVIRAASVSDIDSIYRIECASFSMPWLKETLVHDMTLSYSRYWMAEIRGIPAGYACFWFVEGEAQLVNLAVAPGMRRQGAGAELIRAGLREAGDFQCRTVFLEVRVSNLPAQELYRTFGLTVRSLRKNAYEKPMEDGYIMAGPIDLGGIYEDTGF